MVAARRSVDAQEEDAPAAFRAALLGAFFCSGVSAIVCQVGWQRILTAQGGLDTHSATTTVAAFMLGLGVGNLAGGVVGDRLRPARCFVAYLVLEAAIALLVASSPFFLHGLYGRLAAGIDGAAQKFAVELALLLAPTTLMGATLPVLARALVRAVPDIGTIVGRLYGANTLGAALGGFVMAGPLLLGRVGVGGTLRLAALLNLVSALLVAWVLAARLRRRTGPAGSGAAAKPASPWTSGTLGWTALYALTGFISLSLEILWFRMLQVLLLGTTFTFAALLSLFLVGLGTGSLFGAGVVGRIGRPQRFFLGLQFLVPQLGLLGPLVIFFWIREFGMPGFLGRWLLAAVIVLPPTFLMGLSYPVVQSIVARNLVTLGRHTGALLFANTAGAFLGVSLTGLVLLDRVGTPGTLAGLAVLGGVFALAIWVIERGSLGSWLRLGFATALLVALLALSQPPRLFWAALHATTPTLIEVAEDATCVAALVPEDGREGAGVWIAANGKLQNPYPFTPFHMNLGLLPALLVEQPRRTLNIGLGVGSTSSVQVLEPRVGSLDVVEICGAEERLLREHLGGEVEFQRLFSDPRVRFHVADGRKFLRVAREPFDLIVTDTLLPMWSCSGCLYSEEFYRLARSRLDPDGMLAQWLATPRTALTAAQVFPHVTLIRGPGLRDGILLMASRPGAFQRGRALERLEQLREQLPAREYGVARAALAGARAGRVRAGGPPPAAPEGINTDLFPRDEYAGNWLLEQLRAP